MAAKPDGKPVADYAGRKLKWVQPRALKDQWFLRAGSERIASLTRKSVFGSRMTGESGDGRWTFKRVGFFQTRVTVRRPGSDDDLAVFRHNTWSLGGTLELPDGRRIRATTNLWDTKLDLRTEDDDVLLALHSRGVIRRSATVTIDPAAAGMPELPWMVMLGWYLVIMMGEDAAAVAAAAAS